MMRSEAAIRWLAVTLALFTTTSKAIDENGNGISDVWEWYYGYQGNLQFPADDDERDGDSNFTEAAFGTDPFDPASCQPHVTLLAPAPDLGFSFPTNIGIRYQIQGNPDLLSSWVDIGTPLTGTGNVLSGAVSGPFNDRYFLRLRSVLPRADADADGLDAYEESLFGSRDDAANSDTDDLSDLEEFYLNQLGINVDPSKEFTVPGVRDGEGDFDRDGVKDKDELRGGSNPTSPTSYPPNHQDIDSDGDGLKDSFEVQYFGGITAQTGAGNPDGDRLTNEQEQYLGLNPTNDKSNGTTIDGLSDSDNDGIVDIWEFEDGTDPKSDTSYDLATNYIVLNLRFEHKKSWGTVTDKNGSFGGTKMTAKAIGYETANQTENDLAGIVLMTSWDQRGQEDLNYYYAQRQVRFRKGQRYQIELSSTNSNLPIISGKVLWQSVGNNDEPDNKFFSYFVDGRQHYISDKDGVPKAADTILAATADPFDTHFSFKQVHRVNDPDATTYPTGVLELPPVMIYGDTNRDGVVDSKDAEGKNIWDKNRGAIFSVNCNADEGRVINGKKAPDALEIDDTGAPINEDWEIRQGENLSDITPISIPKIPALSPEIKVFLKAEPPATAGAMPAQKAFHLFPFIRVGAQGIWGAASSTGVPSTVQTGNEVEITKWVNPQATGYAGEADAQGNYTFGIEGLFFRSIAAPNQFEGRIALRIELRKDVNGSPTVIGFDKLELRVAPLLFGSHKEQAATTYVSGNQSPFLSIAGTEIVPTADTTTPGAGGLMDPFVQDMVQVGYTQRPGGPKTLVAFRCPKGASGRHFKWPQEKLLGPAVGVYQLGREMPNGGTGDFGGNIEILPPNNKHRLGRVIVGNNISQALASFLSAQGYDTSAIQAPAAVRTDWLTVGHVDEIINYTGQGEVLVADPKLAFSLLRTEFQQRSADDQGKMVLFAVKTAAPDQHSDVLVETVSQDTPIEDSSKIWTGTNYAGDPGQYSKFKYLRIYSGAGAGQVARIKQDGSGYGNGFLIVDAVWKTGPNTSGGAGTTSSAFFQDKPKTNDRIVLVEDTKLWGNVPALTTTAEILADSRFEAANNGFAKIIDGVKIQLQKYAEQNLTFKPVPVLYYYFGTKASAFTPNLVNCQVVNNQFYFPKPFAPLKTGKDIFEEDVRSRFGITGTFLNDWTVYHLNDGQVHCGSATKRTVPAQEWWKLLK